MIEELNLSIRAYNVLKRRNINSIEELKKLSLGDLIRFENAGTKTINEITTSLLHYEKIIYNTEEEGR